MPGGSKKQKVWKARPTDSDTIMTVRDSRKDDIIIPVMGPTGAGKSTFINVAVGSSVMPIGHDLKSCTEKIQHASVPCPGDHGRRIVFIDMPGFDDTRIDDLEILRRIAVWLALAYEKDMKLAGVIYLHEISQARMFGSAQKNLVMFDKLCGRHAAKKVVLATTKWSDVAPDMGDIRYKQLSDTYWKDMLAQGSQIARFSNTHESAWAIVDIILKNKELDTRALLIQRELVDLQKILPETEAGRTLRFTLQELLESHRRTVRQLRAEKGTPESETVLQERLEETEKQLRPLLKQIQELKVPLGKRIRNFFFS